MRNNIWRYVVGYGHIAENKIAHEHPAIFPLKLAEDHIKSWSNEGDTVLDPFLGSGTTAIACLNLNREFVGFELDEKYFDIAQKRIADAEAEREQSLFKEAGA